MFYAKIKGSRKFLGSFSIQELRSALAEKNEFICIASHELKTPLTALKLQIEMAKKSLEQEINSLSPEKMKLIMNRTHEDVLRLSRLVDDMLDVSRINTGKLNISLEYFCLQDFFESLMERVLKNLSTKNSISWTIDSPVLVKWDKFRMEQVIVNLVNNAIRYGDGSPVELKVTTGGGYAYLKVQDSGPGIPEEQQKRILNKFEQGNKIKDNEGMGLGLYISNEIVKLHSGMMTLKSRVGSGTTFIIQLPLNPDNN